MKKAGMTDAELLKQIGISCEAVINCDICDAKSWQRTGCLPGEDIPERDAAKDKAKPLHSTGCVGT